MKASKIAAPDEKCTFNINGRSRAFARNYRDSTSRLANNTFCTTGCILFRTGIAKASSLAKAKPNIWKNDFGLGSNTLIEQEDKIIDVTSNVTIKFIFIFIIFFIELTTKITKDKLGINVCYYV